MVLLGVMACCYNMYFDLDYQAQKTLIYCGADHNKRNPPPPPKKGVGAKFPSRLFMTLYFLSLAADNPIASWGEPSWVLVFWLIYLVEVKWLIKHPGAGLWPQLSHFYSGDAALSLQDNSLQYRYRLHTTKVYNQAIGLQNY